MLTLDRLRTLEELGITRGSGLSPPPNNERNDLEDLLADSESTFEHLYRTVSQAEPAHQQSASVGKRNGIQ